MARQLKYPIGEQDFAKIRTEGFLYVDKTEAISRMLSNAGNYVFLSRPRRFGKSLLVSTLKAYFEGRKELFEGLYIGQYETEWTKRPVFHFDLSSVVTDEPERMRYALSNDINRYEKQYGIDADLKTTLGARLKTLVEEAVSQTGQNAVILIDEYDSPILNVIDKDVEEIELFRDLLNEFYSPLKGLSSNLRFLFITGITKFSQMSIFSKLNNLNNISMLPEYDSICGITKDELQTVLRPEVEQLAQSLEISTDKAYEQLRHKYDGYRMGNGLTDIYNPFSLVSALGNKSIKNFWFSSGTSSFLLKLLRAKGTNIRMSEMEGIRLPDMAFDKSVERITDFTPILYQSGYLTVKAYNQPTNTYTLGFPNEEVRVGMSQVIMESIAPGSADAANYIYANFLDALFADDIDECMRILQSFMSGIPYVLVQSREDYFQTILYCVFKVLGAPIYCEVQTAQGRSDVVMETPKTVFVMELKFNQNPDVALAQIEEKGYAVPYRHSGKRVMLVGINFSLDERTICEWKVVEQKQS